MVGLINYCGRNSEMAEMMLVVMEMRVMKMAMAITIRINLLNVCCSKVEYGDLHKYFTLHDIV